MASPYGPYHERDRDGRRGRGPGRSHDTHRSPAGSSSDSTFNPRNYRTRFPTQGNTHRGLSRDPSSPFVTVSDDSYKEWREVGMVVMNLPSQYIDTWELYQFFSKFGQISYITIQSFGSGGGGGRARMVFRYTRLLTPFSNSADMNLARLRTAHFGIWTSGFHCQTTVTLAHSHSADLNPPKTSMLYRLSTQASTLRGLLYVLFYHHFIAGSNRSGRLSGLLACSLAS
jgi:hypothetical protein